MAGKTGIGLKIPYEPILLDAGVLPPGSWDMITEAGFGPSTVIISEAGLTLKIEAL
jgi:hypothetical protein|tara:strand:+ start:5727 stop:5894 length:168 start_codon:yes stop_codon:yes gene_type:complete